MKRLIFLIIIIASIPLAAFFSEDIFQTNTTSPEESNKLPIIYHEGYNMTFFGIEKLHPFESTKYKKIYTQLQENFNTSFYTPQKVSEKQLLQVHTSDYLESIKESRIVANILEMGALSKLPIGLITKHLLTPMQYQTGGTILGAELALEKSWAINIGGGFHHAKADKGSGFNVYADIPIAVEEIWETQPDLTVMIIDLDAHQGNGYATVFADNSNITIFDVYNKDMFPWDNTAKKYIDYNHPISTGTQDEPYLTLIKNNLPQAIASTSPGLIIYIAGTDVYTKDPLGQLEISKKTIIERDAFVFNQAKDNNIPILMLLGGGYTSDSTEIIGESITNILTNILEI
jgi:histone deacetylase 11